MKKVELLCPVGNKEMLYQAIHNGADAVYLAGKRFGARKFANNFDDDELIEAISYSHLYGVLVYVTVNTIIYESEIEDVLSYLKFLYVHGVDAVIMQDIGIMKRAREILPDLEIHASTQCHNHNKEGILALKNLGVTRVVMAREMSLSYIASIDVDIEKEVFVYGALCVCYSGCCLFSSMNGGRSGNRGECVGSCRLPYQLLENDKIISTEGDYLLSTRDLNTIFHLKELLDSDIDSLKIEGRMKSPYYVGYVTRVYRRLIDCYYRNESMNVTKEELDNLKKLFHRDFTSGYLFDDKRIMNIKSPNHIGVPVGKVVKVDDKKIYIRLDDDLSQGDGIRFQKSDKGMIVNRLYNQKDLLVNFIQRGNIAVLDNKFGYEKDFHDIVLKTIDSKLIYELERVEEKKIPISYKVIAVVGSPLSISIMDESLHCCSVSGNVVEVASKRPITREEIERQLKKLGNTPYSMNEIHFQMDDSIFISLSELNILRRKLVEMLSFERTKISRNVLPVFDDRISSPLVRKTSKICALVRTEEQLLSCLHHSVDIIYVVDFSLYCKYKGKYSHIFYRTHRVNDCKMDFKNENLLVCELGGASKYSKDNLVVGDYYLNIANHHSIDYFRSLGVQRVTLSVELSDSLISNIMKHCSCEVELLVYGRVELMVMKYCPLKELLGHCTVCRESQNSYYLVSKDKKKFPILHDHCVTSILHCENIDKFSSVHKYKEMGISCYRIELFSENYQEVSRLIGCLREQLNINKK